MEIRELGEIKLLQNLKAYPGVQNIGDDCAVLLGDDDNYQLVTTDILIEDVHFTHGKMSWLDIGHKAVQVNLSDIAAMGGTPTHLFISLGLPNDFKEKDLKNLYEGFSEPGILIYGGDLSNSENLVINICVLGQVPKEFVMLRSEAELGDLVAVTGKLGANVLADYQLVPKARLEEGRELALSGMVTAMTDISDGLARSINDICTESKVSIQIDDSKIPLAEGATIEDALNGGEDYELLFTIQPDAILPIDATVIGEVVMEGQGNSFTQFGYEHFNKN